MKYHHDAATTIEQHTFAFTADEVKAILLAKIAESEHVPTGQVILFLPDTDRYDPGQTIDIIIRSNGAGE